MYGQPLANHTDEEAAKRAHEDQALRDLVDSIKRRERES